MPGSQNIINALKGLTSASHNEATNAANREVSAFDPEKSLFVQGSGRRAAASPMLHYQRSREIRGEMESTGRIGDLAIDKGQGMFVIKTTSGTVALSNMGSFRISDVEQKITGPSGEVLMGWMLDADGGIPTNSSSLESLTELSIKQLAAEAVATDRVNISANLRQEQLSKDGPGGTAEFSVHSVTKIKDLILPGEVGARSTRLGDRLVLTPTAGNGIESKFELGGMAISRQPTAALNGALFGATSASGAFNITNRGVAAQSLNELEHGQGFTITVGNGDSFSFTASKAGNETHLGRFNSLSSLAEAVNLTTNGQVRATVTDNRLVLAAKNANDSLVFGAVRTANAHGTLDAHTALGFIDITAKAAQDPERYASPQELRDKVKGTQGLNARIEGKKVIFSSHVATAALSVSGETSRPRNFKTAYTIDKGVADASSRNAIAIESPNHGLQDGDYVRLSGGLSVRAGAAGVGAIRAVDDKVYRVERLSADRFGIAIQGLLDTGAAPNTPVGNTILDITTANLDGLNWRKVEAGDLAINRYSGTNTNSPATVAGNHAAVVITVNGGTQARSRFGVGDKVFITGSSFLKEGYYNVTAAPGATITVEARVAGGANNARGDFINNAQGIAGFNQADIGMRITKVAARAGANAAERLDPYPVQIFNDERRVRVHMPTGNTVTRGDIIKLSALGGQTVVANGLTLRDNTTYAVTNVDPNGLFYEFEVPAADGPAAIPNNTNTVYVGYEDSVADDGIAIVAGAVAGAVANDHLGATARFENLGKMFSGFGMETDKRFFDDEQAATYSQNFAEGKTMASGNVEPHKTFGTTILDSFGRGHIVNISYLRLDDNKWAVEIWVPQNKDGTFDVDGPNLLRAATLEFDENGRLPEDKIPEVLKNEIDIPWNNGAAQGSVKFDFGDEVDDQGITKSGITMQSGEYDLRFMDPNGNKSGVVESIRYDQDGRVIAVYSNGSSRAFAQLPVAIVQDFNSLIAIGNGHFVVSPNKSGNVILKEAGVGGAGTFLPGFLEASKSDENEALLNMTELNHLRSVALKAVSKEEEVNKLAVQLL